MVVAAINQQPANAGSVHFGEGDLLLAGFRLKVPVVE
jgi:hypothetical protein